MIELYKCEYVVNRNNELFSRDVIFQCFSDEYEWEIKTELKHMYNCDLEDIKLKSLYKLKFSEEFLPLKLSE